MQLTLPALLLGFFYGAFAVDYLWRIRMQSIDPSLSTWILFWVGCSLSLATYVDHGGLWSGSLMNVLDAFVVLVIVAHIALSNHRAFRLQPFEIKYLVACIGIVIFWLLFDHPFVANLMTQGLMSFAYFPMYEALIRTGRVTESFVSWTLVVCMSVCALWSAYLGGEGLAIGYAFRAFVLPCILLLLMAFYAYVLPRFRRS